MRYYPTIQRVLFAITLLGVLAVFLVACSDDDDDTTTATTSNATPQNYNGPGSKWDVNLAADGTFTIEMRPSVTEAIAMSITGTYQRLSASGFLDLTVTSATGTGAPSAGDRAYALEALGYALLLHPIDNSGQLIPMVTSGACPTSDLVANWVIVKKASAAAADDADRDFFGQFNYTAADQSANLPTRRALANSFQDGGAQALGSGTCADGILSLADGVMYLTSNGGAIVHTSVDNPSDASFIFGLAQKAITAVANLDAEYAGLLFDDNQSSDAKISPISMTCSSGACTGAIVTDVLTGTVSSETVTINLSGTPDALGNGLITGTIVNGSDSGNLACMVDINVLDSGKQMLSCVGQSPSDNSKMFNVLMVSKDSA